MRIRLSGARALFALVAALAAGGVYAQAQNAGRNINLMAVNTSNKEIYSVNFANGTTTVGNTDESNFVRPESLVFVVNATTNQLDLLVADNQRGTIYRYPGALAPQTPPNPTTATLVWNSQSQGTGPLAPSAMAVDGFGNLFVANSTAGHSQTSQLWEFPVGAAGSGSFGPPVLIDNSFQNKEILQELTFAPTDIAGAAPVAGGDLIVLTSSRVLDYSQASGYASRTTLLTIPNGNPVAGGMDFWPFGDGGADNYSLLISNYDSATISRYFFTNSVKTPLTAAPAFATGLTSPYRVKTLFQAGKPLVFVSENGAILEYGANPDGSGSLQATVTQNVVDPQGMAVSNAFTNAASVCLQSGGCNLTGLLNHALTNIPGTFTLAGDIVENVCTVNADPRVSTTPAWSCLAEPLLINSVCPGFDDTGTMQIADTACGHSGSSNAGFSIIKTLVKPSQFQVGNTEAYIENSALLADGTEPECGTSGVDGAFLWAPLKAEGTVLESPNMLEVTSGCGTIHGGSGGISVWVVGTTVNEAAPELNPPEAPLQHPLQNLAQTKYSNLTSTIKNLAGSGNITNVTTLMYPGELWEGNVPPANNGSAGCLDNSWQLFFNATQVDNPGSMQQTADLQNAANLLSNADVDTNTTCDAIVTGNPSNFIQSLSPPPVVLNPAGQVRARLANLYYSINTRLLLNIASGEWPAPIMVSVSPTTALIGTTTPTLSWNAAGGTSGGDSGCSFNGNALSGTSGQIAISASGSAGLVQYTVNCTSGPGANATPAWGLSASAWVNWVQPPTLTPATATVLQGSTTTLTYNPGGSTCTLTGNGVGGAAPGTPGSITVSGGSSGTIAATGGTYTLSCPPPAGSVSATVTVVTNPTLTPSAQMILSGTSTTLTANFGGSTNCTVSGTSATVSGNTVTVGPLSQIGTYNYTVSCPAPAGQSAPAVVTVVTYPTLTPSAATVTQGQSYSLAYNTEGSTGCTLTGAGLGASGSITVSGSGNTASISTSSSTTVGPYFYTLTCPAVMGSSGPLTTSATVNVTAAPSTTVSVSPGTITDDSQRATITWNGPSGCKLSDSSSNRHGPGGVLSGTTSSSGGAGPFTATYTSGEPDGGYTITFKVSCTSGASASAQLRVTE